MASPEETDFNPEDVRLARWRKSLQPRAVDDTKHELRKIARTVGDVNRQWEDVEICGAQYKRSFIVKQRAPYVKEDALVHTFEAAGLPVEGLALTRTENGYCFNIPAASFDPLRLRQFAGGRFPTQQGAAR